MIMYNGQYSRIQEVCDRWDEGHWTIEFWNEFDRSWIGWRHDSIWSEQWRSVISIISIHYDLKSIKTSGINPQYEICYFSHKKFILTPIYPRNLIHTVSILKCSLHPTLEKQNYTILSVPSCRDRILKLSRLRIIFLQRLNHSLTFIMMNNVWILEPSCCALWPKLICWKCIPSASHSWSFWTWSSVPTTYRLPVLQKWHLLSLWRRV